MLYPASSFLRRDPFALMRRFGDVFEGPFVGPRAGSYPAVNVWHGDKAAAITAEVPGVESDDIEIAAKDNILTIAGERKSVAGDQGVSWHLSERAFGKFSRAVRLPFQIDANKVEARLENGVLQIVVHRREEDLPRRIKVKAA